MYGDRACLARRELRRTRERFDAPDCLHARWLASVIAQWHLPYDEIADTWQRFEDSRQRVREGRARDMSAAIEIAWRFERAQHRDT